MSGRPPRPHREALLVVMIAALLIFFGLTTPHFLDPLNLADRCRSWVETGLIAVPVTFVIAAGWIDLSVGSLLALAGVVAGRFHAAGSSMAAVIAVALATGLAGGLGNALLMQALRLPPLIVTLATLALFRGLAYGLTGAQSIGDWPEGFTDWGSVNSWHLAGDWTLPWPFLLLLGAVGLGTAAFHRHVLGRQARQVGENATAARFAGIPLPRLRYTLYGLVGLACGLAAVCWTARFATAHPGAAQGLELEVIAVVVIGGTRITGGTGSVPGTFLGLLLLGLLRYGLDLRAVAQQDQTILVGVLVVAVAIVNAVFAPRLGP